MKSVLLLLFAACSFSNFVYGADFFCEHHCRSLPASKIKRLKFTQEEDNIIIQYAEEQGIHHWRELKKALPNRSVRQIRERYRDYLDPAINLSPWTALEDSLLWDLYAQYGNHYSRIAKYFHGRSATNIKNHISLLKRKYVYTNETGKENQKTIERSSEKNFDSIFQFSAMDFDTDDVFREIFSL